MRYQIKENLMNGGVIMENNSRKKLDLSILKNKSTIIVSSREALKEVTPIHWSKAVLSGKKKVIIGNENLP